MPRLILFALALLAAAVAPLLPPAQAGNPSLPFPGWPREFEGRPLAELPLSDLEERFAGGFPGRLGRFSDGTREILARWVTEKTRLLHPSADCFRGAGYEVGVPRLRKDGWSEFTATRQGESFVVRERIEGPGGPWTDTGAWYWSASPGPWWAFTVTERAQPTLRPPSSVNTAPVR